MGKKKKHRQRAPEDAEAARDELLALESIFGEGFWRDSDGKGFSLTVVPHPGEAEANFVKVGMEVRYPPGYPHAPLALKVVTHDGLAPEQAAALAKQLHGLAERHAAQGEVCAFNVIDACQEFLQQHNARPDEPQREPDSLWHEMQLREEDSLAAGAAAQLAEQPEPVPRGWGEFGFGALFREDEGEAELASALSFKSESAMGATPFMQRLALDAAEPPERGRRGAGGQEEPPSSSGSVYGSMLTKVRSAVRGMLGVWPPALRQLLEKQPSTLSSEAASSDEAGEQPPPPQPSQRGGSAGSASPTAEQASLRRDMLLGHLLQLAAAHRGPGDVPAVAPQALPSLTAQLVEEGLIPKWLQRALTQQPALFDQAFARVFARTAGLPPAADPSHAAALQRFWAPRAGGALPRVASAGEPLSRYQTDFQETRVLGRGAFGLAVAAVNRLDGRQYAVKKIRLQRSAAPGEFARIMREVATLARLQHTNIVRYFQAWTEAAPAQELASETEDDSELRGWLRSSNTASSARPHVQQQQQRQQRLGALRAPAVAGLSSELQATSSSGGSSGSGSGSEAGEGRQAGSVQMLFIQMEFCPRTLKQVLALGPIEDADAWQILRQILAGLAHIHSQGIIHRDLKPENIFFDSQAVLKLGDFGLAKFMAKSNEPAAGTDSEGEDGAVAADGGSGSRQAQAQQPLSGVEGTGRVGTSFYMSPEVAQGWARHDAKVDMFSLGVVAFELWHPFATGMERALLLQALRDSGSLPPAWEARHPQVARLIRWLTAANPAERPAARELLRSSLLPPEVGDEQLTDLLRSLPADATALERVMDALFSLPGGAAAEAGEAEGPGHPATGQAHISTREELVRLLQAAFARHGAVPMASRVLGFSGAATPANAAVLLDRGGARLALRHEMRAPFAAWLAQQAALAAREGRGLGTLRRYETAWVRRKARGRALPRAYLQADLDLLGPPALEAGEAALLEAEAAKTIAEVLEALPETPAFELRLGHRALLDALLDYIGLPKDVARPAMEMLATTAAISPTALKERVKHWPSVRIALAGLRVAPDAVARCKHFILQIPGEAEASLQRLRKKLEAPGSGGAKVAPAALAAIATLEAVVGHLHAWDLKPHQVVVDPLLWPHADYLTGTLLQAHVLPPDGSAASALVAAGGRYDGLLKRLWPAQAAAVAPAPAAVGVSVNVKMLLPFMGPARLESATPLSQADVLVCSRGGGGMLRARMALCRELWAAGVRAQFLQAAAPSLTQHYEFANAHRIPWLAVIERPTFSAADTVKVKNLERRTEEGLPFGEVARFLTAQLAGGGGRGEAGRSGSGGGHMGKTHEDADSDDGRPDDERLKILNQRRRRR